MALSFFEMKSHRKQLRRKQKEEKVGRKNAFDITDLTPMNAINLILNNQTTIQWK